MRLLAAALLLCAVLFPLNHVPSFLRAGLGQINVEGKADILLAVLCEIPLIWFLWFLGLVDPCCTLILLTGVLMYYKNGKKRKQRREHRRKGGRK